MSALIFHAQQHDACAITWAWSGKRGKLLLVQSLLDWNGLLAVHAEAIQTYLQRFAELEERRNFPVHAIMTPHQSGGDGTCFRFTMFRPTDEGTDYGSMVATLSETEALADEVDPISVGVAQLVGAIVRSLSVGSFRYFVREAGCRHQMTKR